MARGRTNRKRPIQWSLRTQLMMVGVVAVFFSMVAWYLDQPVRRTGGWNNYLSENYRINEVPRFLVGGWDIGDNREPVVGYIIRIDSLSQLPVSEPRPYQYSGRRYGEGIRIDKSRKDFVLLVGKGSSPLQKIYLDKKMAQQWFAENSQTDWPRINYYKACLTFWETHVVPKLEPTNGDSAK